MFGNSINSIYFIFVNNFSCVWEANHFSYIFHFPLVIQHQRMNTGHLLIP